jgi:hypothetical protein
LLTCLWRESAPPPSSRTTYLFIFFPPSQHLNTKNKASSVGRRQDLIRKRNSSSYR